MIEVDSRPPAAFTEDAVTATVFMATVHVREGELALPERIRAHLADGPVVVHLMRGEDDVAVHEATLTSRSTLTGITWPEDVLPRTSLTVLCPRGGASHDIGVLLPNLNVDWPDDDLPEREPETEGVDPEEVETPDIHGALFGSEPLELGEAEVTAEPVTDEHLAAITGALTALAEAAAPADESMPPGPAEYTVPADLPITGDLAGVEPWPFAEPDAALAWPADEDLAPAENTEVFTAVLVPAVPDIDVDAEPGSVFSAALVAIRSPEPPRRKPGWLERRIRLAARLVLAESHTATRVVMAVVSFLVLASTGVGFLLAEVAR